MASQAEIAPPRIFTTLRYDLDLCANDANTAICGGLASPVYMMTFHHDRLREAAAAIATSQSGVEGTWLQDLQRPEHIAHICAAHVQSETCGMNSEDLAVSCGAWRCTVSFGVNGAVSVKSGPAKQNAQPLLFPTSFDTSNEPLWTVVLDTQPTALGLTTTVKTSDRDMYDRAREASGISTPAHTKEVLLYNTDNVIMDGSITTPYLFRKGRWVTPSASSGGQQGVTRRWALQQGLCSEGTVSRHSMEHGETIWLSNAFRGFFAATFRTVETQSPP